jgi:hypothetical protein
VASHKEHWHVEGDSGGDHNGAGPEGEHVVPGGEEAGLVSHSMVDSMEGKGKLRSAVAKDRIQNARSTAGQFRRSTHSIVSIGKMAKFLRR